MTGPRGRPKPGVLYLSHPWFLCSKSKTVSTTPGTPDPGLFLLRSGATFGPGDGPKKFQTRRSKPITFANHGRGYRNAGAVGLNKPGREPEVQMLGCLEMFQKS